MHAHSKCAPHQWPCKVLEENIVGQQTLAWDTNTCRYTSWVLVLPLLYNTLLLPGSVSVLTMPQLFVNTCAANVPTRRSLNCRFRYSHLTTQMCKKHWNHTTQVHGNERLQPANQPCASTGVSLPSCQESFIWVSQNEVRQARCSSLRLINMKYRVGHHLLRKPGTIPVWR